MVTMWTPCSFQVDTTWFPCGQDHLYPLQMRSRSIETRSRLDLFLTIPHDEYYFLANFHHFQITSVAIRSRKSDQSLKACNSLNNGLNYNPEKVLESS